ncbi:MAG: signal peptidase II [Ruminococcaceae bacterium]|nr:signal peptidase II [Oscillospiraceae bacterium]
MEVLVIAAVVVLDQLSKILTVKLLKPIGTFPIIEDVLHLTYVENTGASFGILKDHRWVFMTVSTVAILAILILLIVWRDRLSPMGGFSMAMIVGGGIGNMIDRIAYGYVVDMIDFRLIHFAVFNVADSFIVVGTILLAVYVLFFESRNEHDQTAADC